MADTNSWAYEFYRVVEDFVYGVFNIEEFKTRMVNLGVPTDVYNYMITAMTSKEHD